MQEWAQGRPARQPGSYETPLYAHSAMTSTRTVTTAPAHLQAMLGGRCHLSPFAPGIIKSQASDPMPQVPHDISAVGQCRGQQHGNSGVGARRMHTTWQHAGQAFAVLRRTSSQGDGFLILMLQMLSRSQGAYWTPPGPFTAGHPVRHQAPGLYDSLRSALGPRFASADTPLPNTLTPRPAATDNPLHDTLAQRFAAMEVSPHGATPEEEQAGLPALMAAGAYLYRREPY